MFRHNVLLLSSGKVAGPEASNKLGGLDFRENIVFPSSGLKNRVSKQLARRKQQSSQKFRKNVLLPSSEFKSKPSNRKQAELGEVSEEYTASIIRVEEQSKQSEASRARRSFGRIYCFHHQG
jgi:hypothetical protein